MKQLQARSTHVTLLLGDGFSAEAVLLLLQTNVVLSCVHGMQAGLLERDEELCGLYERSAALQQDIDEGGLGRPHLQFAMTGIVWSPSKCMQVECVPPYFCRTSAPCTSLPPTRSTLPPRSLPFLSLANRHAGAAAVRRRHAGAAAGGGGAAAPTARHPQDSPGCGGLRPPDCQPEGGGAAGTQVSGEGRGGWGWCTMDACYRRSLWQGLEKCMDAVAGAAGPLSAAMRMTRLPTGGAQALSSHIALPLQGGGDLWRGAGVAQGLPRPLARASRCAIGLGCCSHQPHHCFRMCSWEGGNLRRARLLLLLRDLIELLDFSTGSTPLSSLPHHMVLPPCRRQARSRSRRTCLRASARLRSGWRRGGTWPPRQAAGGCSFCRPALNRHHCLPQTGPGFPDAAL